MCIMCMQLIESDRGVGGWKCGRYGIWQREKKEAEQTKKLPDIAHTSQTRLACVPPTCFCSRQQWCPHRHHPEQRSPHARSHTHCCSDCCPSDDLEVWWLQAVAWRPSPFALTVSVWNRTHVSRVPAGIPFEKHTIALYNEQYNTTTQKKGQKCSNLTCKHSYPTHRQVHAKKL